MRKLLLLWWRIGMVVCVGAVSGTVAGAQKLKPEELVAKHLEALGPAGARAAKTRLAQGTVALQVVVGGQASLAGNAEVLSQGSNSLIGMEFGHSNYQRERIVCRDGSVEVAYMNQARRSLLGEFLYTKSQIVSEGLFGGVLSTAWPLLDVAGHEPKLKYEGLKKVDGRELHALRYQPRKRGGELEIRLYFDPATFQHVKTVYYFTIRAAMGAGSGLPSSQTPAGGAAPSGAAGGTAPGQADSPEVAAARLQENRYRLEEDFEEFRAVGGVSQPTRWKIRLTVDTTSSSVWEWQIQWSEIRNNADLGPGTFTVKQP